MDASLLANMLAGKGVVRGRDGAIQSGEEAKATTQRRGVIRAGKGEDF